MRNKHTGLKFQKHGMSRTSIHGTWQNMRNRCSRKNDKNYKLYGGRGIKVCERWESFVNFYADMGDKPTPKHSIERIDGNGNYEPSNCKWATASEQARNRKTTRFVPWFDGFISLASACEILGLDYKDAHRNIKRHGISFIWSGKAKQL